MTKASSLFLRAFSKFFSEHKLMIFLCIIYVAFSVVSALFAEESFQFMSLIGIIPFGIIFICLWGFKDSKGADAMFPFVTFFSAFTLIAEIISQSPFRSTIALLITMGIAQLSLVIGSISKMYKVFTSQDEEAMSPISIWEIVFSILVTGIFGLFLILGQKSFSFFVVFVDLGFIIFTFIVIFISFTLHFQYLCIGSWVKPSLLFLAGILLLVVGNLVFCLDITNEIRYFEDTLLKSVYLISNFLIFSSVMIKR